MDASHKGIWKTMIALFLPVMAAALAGCGGGGGSMSGTGTSVTTGAIQKFGSVFVNGVEFMTSAGTHRRMLDDGAGDMIGNDNDVFREGMVVTVRHDDMDEAAEIEFEDNLKGPVSNISLVDNTFRVFGAAGQLVIVDGKTKFFDDTSGPALTSLSGLADNDVVEVSGLADATGAIHATFVERKNPGIMFEIKGFVINLNNTTKTFSLGQVPAPTLITVPVDFSGINNGMMNLPTPVANGVFVEVKTRSVTTPLVAVNVEPKKNEADELEGAERVDIEGFPAAINAGAMTFTLNGVTVSASGAMFSPAGKSFADIATTSRIEVEGTMSGTTLMATRIVFET